MDLSTFIMKLYSKNNEILLNDLKVIINESLLYFSDIFKKIGYSQKNIVDISETMVKEGYQFYFKIDAILKTLTYVDSSQTNKFKYEECLEHLISPSNYLNSWSDFKTLKNDLDIAKNENLIKLNLNNLNQNFDLIGCAEEYSRLIEEKKELLIYERVNIIINNLNQIILNITTVKIIIKDIY